MKKKVIPLDNCLNLCLNVNKYENNSTHIHHVAFLKSSTHKKCTGLSRIWTRTVGSAGKNTTTRPLISIDIVEVDFFRQIEYTIDTYFKTVFMSLTFIFQQNIIKT